jgi:hypothetical protein
LLPIVSNVFANGTDVIAVVGDFVRDCIDPLAQVIAVCLRFSICPTNPFFAGCHGIS